MTTVITTTIGAVVNSQGYDDWWCPCGVYPAGCLAAYRAKGVASLSDSYINLANPGTYDLTGATPTWDTAIGWTEFVAFDIKNIITIPMTAAWRGKLNDSGSVRNRVFYGTGIFTGFFCITGGSGNLIVGMNFNSTPMFNASIADFNIQHTIVYQKLVDESQNLWIDGILIAGSPKAGTTPQDYTFGLQTADNKCESAALYNVALTPTQVVDLTDAMEAL